MGKNGAKKFMIEKDKKLHVEVILKYDDGKKTHIERFKRYALFGQWMARHYRKVKNIVYIRVNGNY